MMVFMALSIHYQDQILVSNIDTQLEKKLCKVYSVASREVQFRCSHRLTSAW